MRRWMLTGVLLLGMGAGAGEERATGAAQPKVEDPVGASAGAGGAAEVDLGHWATPGQGARDGRRAFYAQVAKELQLEAVVGGGRSSRLPEGEAVGGGGQAGDARHRCAEALAAGEGVTLLSGTLSFAGGEVLIIDVPGQGPVRLRADEGTCAVEVGRVRSVESLSEGTEVKATYVVRGGESIARVVRVEPERPQR